MNTLKQKLDELREIEKQFDELIEQKRILQREVMMIAIEEKQYKLLNLNQRACFEYSQSKKS